MTKQHYHAASGGAIAFGHAMVTNMTMLFGHATSGDVTKKAIIKNKVGEGLIKMIK